MEDASKNELKEVFEIFQTLLSSLWLYKNKRWGIDIPVEIPTRIILDICLLSRRSRLNNQKWTEPH